MQRVSMAPPRFAEQTAAVAVVGLGKIGLPLAIQYVSHGRHVVGCDVNPRVVAAVNGRQAHVREEVGLSDAVAEAVAHGRLSATLETTAAVRAADVVVVIVPVLVTDTHEIDFGALDRATAAVGAGLEPGKLVIYETTLPVGTTARRLRSTLERTSGLRAGRDFCLAYSPERVSSGRVFHDLATYPKVVGGIDADSTLAAVAFYRSVLDADVLILPSTDDAEFVKLIETTYRDVNIALANEFARYADRHGLDAHAAIAAANSQPYSHLHDPSVGVGGHCIPVYPYFLLQGEPDGLSLPRRARAINDAMADYAVQRLEATMGPVSGRAVLILGAAYRGEVRESAFSSARLLQAALRTRGASVYAHDPLFSDLELKALGYAPLKPKQVGDVAAIILQADHQAYKTLDFSQFTGCRAVLDGRRALRRETIEALNMRYLCIGDGGQTGA